MNNGTKAIPDHELKKACFDAFHEDDGNEETSIPETIGRYPVTGFIGRGGMGCVYSARHPELGTDVAIKVIRKSFIHHEKSRKRFLEEARLAMELSHKNIVRIHDVSTDPKTGLPFIVQECVTGGSLEKEIESRPGGRIPLERTIRIVTCIAEALQEAEANNIVHRDVKPENVLFTKDGIPKLIDMGIAKRFNDERETNPKLTQGSFAPGSPLYAAPEAVEKNGKVDSRADIYSLGVTFYQMISGELPYAAETPHEILKKHRLEDVPNPSEANPDLAESVSGIVMKMMAKRPEDRYQSMQEVCEALSMKKLNRTPLFWSKAIMATFILGAALLGVFQNFIPEGDDTLFAQVEEHLLYNRPEQAQLVLDKYLTENPGDARALYTLGLCALEAGDSHAVRSITDELLATEESDEFGKHLQVLAMVAEKKYERAEKLIRSYVDSAHHKLPFLTAEGRILLQKRKLGDAESALSRAVYQEAGFFDFQRIEAADILGQLFLSNGHPDQAATVYASVLDASKHAPGKVYANYAMALADAGDPGRAQQVISKAMAVNPNDETIIGAAKELNSAGNEIRKIDTLLEQIKALNDRLDRTGKNYSKLQSTPIVLAFLPANGAANANLYRKIINHMYRQSAFPIVEREDLNQILVEQNLAASNLSADSPGIRLRNIWPASVLLRPDFMMDGETIVVTVKLESSETSEVIGLVEQTMASKNMSDVENLSQKVEAALKQYFPAVGTLTEVDGEKAEISLGEYHGLHTGMVLEVYDIPGNQVANVRKLNKHPVAGEVKVIAMDGLTATVEPVGQGVALKFGMVVAEQH